MIEGSEMMRLEFAKAWARQTAILGLKVNTMSERILYNKKIYCTLTLV